MIVTVISNGKTRIADLEQVTELTPETAIRFRNLAFGLEATATVTDGKKAYHVAGYSTLARADKVEVPEGHEVPTQEVIKKCAWCQCNEPTISGTEAHTRNPRYNPRYDYHEIRDGVLAICRLKTTDQSE